MRGIKTTVNTKQQNGMFKVNDYDMAKSHAKHIDI